MSIIVRLHNYVAGNVVLSQYHNVNETTLYNVINGNLNDTNMKTGSSGLTEDSIWFKTGTDGHQHDGVAGSGGAKINLSQNPTPEDYLIQLDALTTGSALKVFAAASGKAGVYGEGKGGSSYGVHADNTAGGVSLQVHNTGNGVGTYLQGAVSATVDNTLRVELNRTAGAGKAAIHIPVVSHEDNFGILLSTPEGVGLRIDKIGTTSDKFAIQLTGDTTQPLLHCTPSGTGRGIVVDNNGSGEGIYVDGFGSSSEGIRVNMGTTPNYGLAIEGSGSGASGGIFVRGISNLVGLVTVTGDTVINGLLTANGDVHVAAKFTHGVAGELAFYGKTGIPRPLVIGPRSGNSALTSLLIALDDLGLVSNFSTA